MTRFGAVLTQMTVIALVLTACTDGSTDTTGGASGDSVASTIGTVALSEAEGATSETETSVAPEPTVSPPTTVPRQSVTELVVDPESGNVIEQTIPAPGPTTFNEVVDYGIDAGLWNEIEGLERVLGYAVGAVPSDQVPGVGEVLTGELTEVLSRSNSMALSGEYTDEQLAGLRRWYELAVPSAESIAMLVDSSTVVQALGSDGDRLEVALSSQRVFAERGLATGEPQGVRSRSSIQPAGCVPINPEEFGEWAVVEGCYAMYEDVVEGATIRVLYPVWYSDDPALADYPLITREALMRSVSTYSAFGEIGDITVVFSLAATAESESTPAWAGVDSQFGTATIADGCPVTVFPDALTLEDADKYRQVIAHEAWHCTQHYSGFPQGVPSGTAWFREGGAEYFSNVVYPDVNREYYSLGAFDDRSRTEPLFDLSYEASVWWQFLANRESSRAIADLHVRMNDDGDGGRSAMVGYGPAFQRFVVEYVAGTIRDTSGAMVPAARRLNKPNKVVAKGDVGKVVEISAQPFVAVRYAIGYDKELRVFESDQTSTDGELAMVEWGAHTQPDAWKQVFPEVRSKCKDKTYYAVVATTEKGEHKAKIQIDRIEEASCDPCVLGSWELDLDTFGAMLRSAMGAEGGALPAGAFFDFSGHYYTSLDEQGVMREQRDDLVVTAGTADGSLSFTIDSFAEGSYTADGERMTVSDVVEAYANVTASVPGFGGSTFAQGSSVMGGGSGTYACRADDMTVTMESMEPVRFVRIDKILSPPTTIAP